MRWIAVVKLTRSYVVNRTIMPTSGLCRAAGHGSRNPGHSGEATRHNPRDSRTASSASSGRFRPGLEASLPTECTRFGAVTCRTIYEWPLPLWQRFDPGKPTQPDDAQKLVHGAIGFWNEPPIGAGTLKALQTFAQSAVADAKGQKWKQQQYPPMAQNALRHLIAVSPEFQVA